MKNSIVLEDLSDEELLSLVNDINLSIVPSDSLLRTIALQKFGTENTMSFIQVGMLILPIIAERMKHYSPHITK